MLEKLNLERKLPGEEFRKMLPGLQRRLYDLEKACWDNGVPSVVVFEGWDAAGKGGAISLMTGRLDPRGFKLYTIDLPRTFEKQRPWLYRYWLRVPNRGEMVIFDHSWYTRVLRKRVDKLIPESAWRAAYQDIVDFERMLADDGTVIVKFFLHISKKEQKKRFKKILEDPLESWRIDREAWRQHRQYDEYVVAIEEMLERTESEFAPWTIVEATSRGWARKKVFDTVIGALEQRLGEKAPPETELTAEAALHDADLRRAMERLEGREEGNGEEG
jgi:polyphosphate kinase 2 (PPK2 family)